MRVYLPMTLPELRQAYQGGAIGAGDGLPPIEAHAVTPAIREWYVSGDQEELEYAVLTEAAQAALRQLAGDPGAPRRRVVIAADVPDTAVRPRAPGPRSAVALGAVVALSAVASVHVDEPESAPTVAAAVSALPAAEAGDEDAQFLLDEAEACDLLWYDVTEIPDLI